MAYRRNSFTASKNSGDPQHSAAVTEFLPEGCFSYEVRYKKAAVNRFNCSCGIRDKKQP